MQLDVSLLCINTPLRSFQTQVTWHAVTVWDILGSVLACLM